MRDCRSANQRPEQKNRGTERPKTSDSEKSCKKKKKAALSRRSSADTHEPCPPPTPPAVAGWPPFCVAPLCVCQRENLSHPVSPRRRYTLVGWRPRSTSGGSLEPEQLWNPPSPHQQPWGSRFTWKVFKSCLPSRLMRGTRRLVTRDRAGFSNVLRLRATRELTENTREPRLPENSPRTLSLSRGP